MRRILSIASTYGFTVPEMIEELTEKGGIK